MPRTRSFASHTASGPMPIAQEPTGCIAVLVAWRAPGRRSGAIMVVDPANALRGIFTDSDLARLFESRRDTCSMVRLGMS